MCPHRPRNAQSPARTEAKTREYLAWMQEFGRFVPVHYQEPFRRGYGKWQPQAEDYVIDARGAKRGGAAAGVSTMAPAPKKNKRMAIRAVRSTCVRSASLSNWTKTNAKPSKTCVS